MSAYAKEICHPGIKVYLHILSFEMLSIKVFDFVDKTVLFSQKSPKKKKKYLT